MLNVQQLYIKIIPCTYFMMPTLSLHRLVMITLPIAYKYSIYRLRGFGKLTTLHYIVKQLCMNITKELKTLHKFNKPTYKNSNSVAVDLKWWVRQVLFIARESWLKSILEFRRTLNSHYFLLSAINTALPTHCIAETR